MKNDPNTNNLTITEARKLLQTIQDDWTESLEELIAEKDNLKTNDLFAFIDYLTFCDQLSRNIYVDLKEISKAVVDLESIKRKSIQEEEIVDSLIELKDDILKKRELIEEEYNVLAEETLRNAQDQISELTQKLQQEKATPNLKTDINQNLEKELFLEELKDSLETYREARENHLTEVNFETLNKQPEDKIHEDLGEENPEYDGILSQLDTTITECDAALLIKEISE